MLDLFKENVDVVDSPDASDLQNCEGTITFGKYSIQMLINTYYSISIFFFFENFFLF